MKRHFKEGETIFHHDCRNDDLRGFGKVLEDIVVENDDDIVLIKVNHSGETQAFAEDIYKISKNRVCADCGCVVCVEHHEDIDYPYYCPDAEENKLGVETNVVPYNRYKTMLEESRGRFLSENYDGL